MDPITRALRHRVEGDAKPVVTPLHQSSAFHADSPFFYSRKNNPNVAELEQVIATLEGAKHGVAVSTGMAAIALVTSLLVPGDRVAVNRLLYGCSFRFFDRLRKKGIEVHACDVAADPLPRDVRMVFFETPTNPFLRTVDVRAVVAKARAASPRALVVVDNTWATPLFQKPLALGADFSLHSATKFIGGHSDVMGGLVLTDRGDLADAMREERFYSGAVMDPHAAWLLRRSVQTLPLRMREHQEVTARMARFLAEQPQVAKVHVPETGGQLSGYGGILFFELRAELADRYADFAKALTLFSTGTGMAAVTSMVAQPWSGSHASMTADEKRAIGLGPGLVRLCFGFEAPDDLEADLRRALPSLEAAR